MAGTLHKGMATIQSCEDFFTNNLEISFTIKLSPQGLIDSKRQLEAIMEALKQIQKTIEQDSKDK